MKSCVLTLRLLAILGAGFAWADPVEGVIAGRVIDADTRAGIANAEIFAGSYTKAVSDTDGYFWFTELRARTYRLWCEKAEGYALNTDDIYETVSVTNENPGVEVLFEFHKSHPISGVVLDPAGNRLPGARISGSWYGWNVEATSDTTGFFVLDGLSKWAKVQLHVEAPGIIDDYTLKYEVPDGGLENIKLHTIAAAGIRGLLMDADGRPMANTIISMRRHTPGVNLSGMVAKTDTAGRFENLRLIPAEHIFLLRPEDGPEKRLLRHHFKAGELLENVEFVYDVDAGLKTSGRLLSSEGDPMADAQIYFWIPEGRHQIHLNTDSEGQFTILDLDEGGFNLFAEVDYQGYRYQKRLKANGGDSNLEIVVKLNPPQDAPGMNLKIAGTVLDAATGKPVPGFSFLLRPWQPDLVPPPDWRYVPELKLSNMLDSVHYSSMQPNNAGLGRFTHETIKGKKNRYWLVIRARGYGTHYEEIDLPAEDCTIRLYPETPIKGLVLAPDGTPLSGAHIVPEKVTWFPQNEPQREPIARSGQKGEFVLGGFAGETATLTVWHQEYGSLTKSISLTSGPTAQVDFRFQPVGRLAGEVLLNNQPVKTASIKLVNINDGTEIFFGDASYNIGDDLKYEFVRLKPGDYELTVVPYNDKGKLRDRSQSLRINVHGYEETFISTEH